MKLQHVNVHNVRHLVPSWAIDPFTLAKKIDSLLPQLYAEHPECRPANPNMDLLKFWIEVDTTTNPASIRFAMPDEHVDLCGRFIITCKPLIGNRCQIDLPLNTILKGHDSAENLHSVYWHSFQTDVQLGYFGITKKPWYERLAQHISAAKAGSPYLFHRAIVQHQDVMVLHKVMLAAVDEETALAMEEKWVGMMSLYPLGLNMIPGGKAGIRYLGTLGCGKIANAEQRDRLVESLSTMSTLAGKPNPLCAARWAADEGYVERVICGHSGRLTAEQVRTIRQLSVYGKGWSEIMTMLGTQSERQVRNVVRGSTYSRIK